METPKKYFQDKLILLLASGNIFLAFLCTAFIFLRIGQGSGTSYIVEYRSNLGISRFSNGDIFGIISFIGFVGLTAFLNILLSMRVYEVHRSLAATFLGSGILLLLLAFIVSNALLVLR